MRCLSLETVSFRNLADQRLDPCPRFNVFAGENAQGKTNLLEAIYLIATLRSFRAQKSAEMVRFAQQEARVSARVEVRGVERHVGVRVHERGRQALVDHKTVRSGAQYLEGTAAVVLFTPDDVLIPRGSPGQRRRLLDRAVANLWPTYVKLARDYQKVLGSRNRLLREGRGGPLLETYDQQLAERGAQLVVARRRFLAGLLPHFEPVFKSMTRSQAEGTLHYMAPELPAEGELTRHQVAEALLLALKKTRRVDAARRSTTVGPHAHDLDFRLDGRSSRQVGSQGQQRALVLAFKISQVLHAEARLGDHPILLLDDVSSEFDAKRIDYLFEFINKIPCQSFLTTTQPGRLPLAQERFDFQLVKGEIQRSN